MFGQTQAMARQWAAAGRIDAVQVVYSLLNREAQGLIGDLADQGSAWSPASLCQWFFVGKVRPDTVFPPGSLNARYSPEEVAARVGQVERLQFLVGGPIETMPQQHCVGSLAMGRSPWY